MKRTPPLPSSPRRAFTLVEVIMAMAILAAVTGIILSFFTETTKAAFVSEQKNKINNDIRRLTKELSEVARQANYMILYTSFDESDRASSASRLYEGNAGDFILLGFQGPPDLDNPVFAARPTTRLIGYFRAPSDPDDPSSTGPVRRFDTDELGGIPDPADPLNPPDPESLIPASSTMNSFPVVVELAEGLADQRLFYNFGDSTIMINAKILHGNNAKRVTDTYNMTISTRH